MTKSHEETTKQFPASDEAGDLPEEKLIHLPIPQGWAVTYNALFEGDPIISAEGDHIENFTAYKEDVLTLERMAIENGEWVISRKHDLIIDVGWYPDSDPLGEYVLRILRNQWQDCVYEESARNQKILRDKLSKLLNSDLSVYLNRYIIIICMLMHTIRPYYQSLSDIFYFCDHMI